MTDIMARQRQLIGSPAEWNADDIIIGKGEFALEVSAGVIKMKVGDGVKLYSALPYIVTGSGGTATPLGTYLPLDCTTATAPGFRTLAGGFYLGNPSVTADGSVLEITSDNDPATGDMFGFAVQDGGNAGFDFVSRGAGNKSHWLRWTRNGLLVLSNAGNTDNMAMEVYVDGGGKRYLAFEHVNLNGLPDGGSGVFQFKGASSQLVQFVDGVASQTGTPTNPQHLITMGYADANYAAKGAGVTGYLPIKTNKLQPGLSTIDGGFYLKDTLNPLGHPTSGSDGKGSVLEFTQTKTANGDEFGFSVQQGGNAGFDFVSRGANNKSHWLRWTRNGVLVLSNSGNTDNMAMEVYVDGGGKRYLVFEHVNLNGLPDGGSGVFQFKGASSQLVQFVDGVASQTGTPTNPQHLITMGYADANYVAKGAGVTGYLPLKTVKTPAGAALSTIDGGFYLRDTSPASGSTSTMEFTADNDPNTGDMFGFAVQDGGNAGFDFVSRGANNKSHWLRWTRNGLLVLSNSGNTDNMAMEVYVDGGGKRYLVFEHVNLNGLPDGGSGVFQFKGANNQLVQFVDGVASQTGTPTSPQHLITMGYADANYAAKGASVPVTGSYLPLTGGILTGGLQIKDNGIGGGIYLNPNNVQARVHMQMENVGGIGLREEFGMAIQTGGNAGFRFTSRDVGGASHSMQWTRNGMFVLSNNTNNNYMGIQVTTYLGLNLMTFQHTDQYGTPSSGSNSFVFQGSGTSNVVLTNGVAQQTGTPSANVHLMTRGASDARYARASDKDLKKGIKQGVGDALAALNKLNPVAFQYRAGTDCKIHETHSDHFGFIAQEVSEVIPELVYENEAKHFGLDYLELIPLLVKAVQQLNEKLEAI